MNWEFFFDLPLPVTACAIREIEYASGVPAAGSEWKTALPRPWLPPFLSQSTNAYAAYTGLLPDAVYTVTCYGNRVQTNDYSASVREYRDLSGRGAANAGIRVELLGDYDCRILHFRLRK